MSGTVDAAWIVRADGAGHRPFPTEGGYQIPFWSPRGSELAYARDARGLDPADGIYVLPREGGPSRRVSGGSVESVGDPVWSPRGSLIAYLQDSRGTGKDGLYVVRRDGSQRRRIATLPDRHRNGVTVLQSTISWSPDERSITYSTESEANPPDMAFAVDVASGRRTRLGRGEAMFSPRRQQIVLSDLGGRLILMRRDGRSTAVLGTGVQTFAWSLDANRIAYTKRDGLWVVDVANHKPRRVFPWTVPPDVDDVGGVVWSNNWR